MKSIINSKDNNSLETKQENDSNFNFGTQPELNEHTTTGSQQINNFQRQYGNMATLKLFQETMLAQTELQSDQGQDVFEAEADQVAENTVDAQEEQPRLTPAGIRIQRTPAGDNPAPTTSPPQATQTDPGAAAARPALIVEDNEADLQPNQMRKSEFLSQLRTSVCAAAETALAGTMFSAMGCPWIDHWFNRYSTQNGRQLEATIRRFVPAAGVINSAGDYIPLITNRVRQSIETWTSTGQITGLPEGFSVNLPGSSGFLAGLANSDSSILRGAGSVISGIGRLLFKTRDNNNSRPSIDPHQIQSQLGSGHSLDSGVQSRMGSVFGQSFSNVRIHTDANAGNLSRDLNARAFTIGQDIAFGAAEYRPGTLVGDALIAHELAHVVQQGGGSPYSAPQEKGTQTDSSFEDDADLSAVGAIAQIWGGIKGVSIGKKTMPFLRTGLRLQRCGGCGGCSTVDEPAQADRIFEQYRDIFNAHWNTPAFNTMSAVYEPTLSSNGPRTPKSRAIFERILNDHTTIRETYNSNTGGIKERIDSYTGPEGLNLIGSPRLTALQGVFNRYSRPISATDYPAFKTAIQGAAANLDDQDRAAINLSNEWQRLINDYVIADAQRSEIRGIITPRIIPVSPPVTSEPTSTPLTPAEQLSTFITNWEPQISFWNGAGQVSYGSGSRVQYWGGTQNFSVGSFSSVANPGQVMFVRARILRGSDTAHTAVTASFPSNQNRMARIAMPITAPSSVPSSGETLTFRLELLADDRTTILKTSNVSMTVFPEVTYTQAQAEQAANDDNNYFHNNTSKGLLGKMTANGGIQANVVAAINAGRITLRPLTQRHDSSEHVNNRLGRYDPSKVGYFIGVNYSTSLIDVAGAGGFSMSAGNIVINRTTNVATGNKQNDNDLITMLVHEAVHALDIRPDSGTDIEHYKTEFRAYWMDGRFGPPDQGTCPSPALGCKSTVYNPGLSPPGPKSERARAIFNLLYGSGTYPFVEPAYDNNTNGFRQVVDSYLIPDGINLIVSLKLEALRDLIEDYGWSSAYWAFRLRVQAQVSGLNDDEQNEITRNRAWRDLVERQVTSESNQTEIKTIMGIPH